MGDVSLIKHVREEAKMTQAEFAKHLGCTQAALSRFETGSRGLSIKMAKKLIELAKTKKIKVKLEDFYPDEENNT